MSWLIPSLVAALVGTSVLSLVYLYLYAEYRERYLGLWGACWSVYVIQLLFALWAALRGGSVVLDAAYHLFASVSGTLLYWGVQEFAGRRWSRALPAGLALAAAWLVFALAARLSFLDATLPLYLFLGGVYIRTGVLFSRMKEVKGFGRGLTSWAFILWGVHKLDYPFLRQVAWFAPWGFLLAATLSLLAALGTVLVFFQRTRTAMSQSEERFRLLAENARDVIFHYRLRPTRRFKYISPAVAAITGYGPEEFYRDPGLLGRIVHPDDAPLLETLAGSPGDAHPELRWLRKDGSEIWVELRTAPIHDDSGNLVALEGIARNITERKRLEDRLLQSQKMEAVGRLAGGVAHDFNNLLTAINGYGDLLSYRMGPDDPRRKEVDEIRKAGSRAAGLTRQLLAFSRRQVLQPKVLDLNDLVDNLCGMLKRLIGDDVRLVTALAPGLGRVKADPGQIEQVLLNLAVNARDAMPQGGTLTVATSHVNEGDDLSPWHITALRGPHVAVTVTDTGCGMDEEILSHLFEPFFTTKEVGKGTGLGLATVYGVVKQSGGAIGVSSTPGRGTSFRVLLPKTEEPLAAVGNGDGPPGASAGEETILVVEDEEAVRTLICEVLRRDRYSVLAASCGEEALKMCARYGGPIHLVLTDVVMPGMNGRELANRLRAFRPEMTVLYTSGYTANAIVHHGVLDEGAAFLPKPFTPAALTRKVREGLDTRDPADPCRALDQHRMT